MERCAYHQLVPSLFPSEASSTQLAVGMDAVWEEVRVTEYLLPSIHLTSISCSSAWFFFFFFKYRG
jgi:hypothetical protein